MVRCKVMLLVFCFSLALVMAMPSRASAAEPYEGNISTTYITIFRDIATNLGLNDDYVFYRSGQYEYQMVVGELDYTGSVISADGSVKIYRITTNSGYSSDYVYTITTANSFSLTPGDALIYTNLGEYPDLIERSVDIEFATLALLFIGLCCYLLRSIFNFSLRFRHGGN